MSITGAGKWKKKKREERFLAKRKKGRVRISNCEGECTNKPKILDQVFKVKQSGGNGRQSATRPGAREKLGIHVECQGAQSNRHRVIGSGGTKA